MSENNLSQTVPNNVTTNRSSTTASYTSADIGIMTIVHSIIGSVGIIANLTVVIVFLNHKKFRQKIPNIFIIHQSLLDFCASFILLLSSLTVTDHYLVQDDGTVGWIQCHMWNSKFMMWGFFGCSTWNIVTLTIERYLELVHTLWHKVHFKKRWIYIAFTMNWTIGLTVNAGYLIPTTKIVEEECIISAFWPSDLFGYIFGFFLFGLEYLFPLLILIYCYGRIVWVLSRRLDSTLGNIHIESTNRNEIANGITANNASNKFQLARKNTIKTFALVGLCFVICLSNAHIYYFMYNLGYELDYNGTYYQFTVLMVFLNCTVNPFIYLIKYKDYQEALGEFLGCEKRRDEQDGESNKNASGSLSSISGSKSSH